MSDLTNELVRLGELRERGLITQEEFDAAKAKLLGQTAGSDHGAGQPPEMPPSVPPQLPPQLPPPVTPQAAPQARPSVLRPPVDDIPPGIKGWSWGAFLWNWIWAIFNNTWIGLLALIPGVNLVMIFVLGAKGREWAWKNKKWDSVEHFNRVQRNWSLWGIWLAIASLVLALLVILASFFFMAKAGSEISGFDGFEVPQSGEVSEPAYPQTEEAASAAEENAGPAIAEDAVPLVAEDAMQDMPQTPMDAALEAGTEEDAAAEQARQQQAELARIKAEADAAKAEAAKAKKDALKAEKALAEQRRRQEAEEARLAQEQAEQEQMECPYSRGQPLTCSSRQGQPAYCDWNFRACGNPRISKKESKTTCDGKVDWDTENDQLIVTEGCRAQFIPVQ